MKTALIVIALAALTAIGVSGCGGSTSSCEDAIKHAFSVGCTSIIPGGTQGTEQDAIDGCNAEKKLVDDGTCDCKSQFNAGLDCFKTVTSTTCTTQCTTELAALLTCFSTSCSMN